jgi:hypothetical protein
LSGLDNFKNGFNWSIPLKFGDVIDSSFINQYETPIVNTAVS